MTAVFTGKAVMLIRKVRLLLTDSLTSNLCSKHFHVNVLRVKSMCGLRGRGL